MLDFLVLSKMITGSATSDIWILSGVEREGKTLSHFFTILWIIWKEKEKMLLMMKVKGTPRGAFFAWETMWEHILTLNILIKRERFSKMSVIYAKVKQSLVISSSSGVLLLIIFGHWFTDYWGWTGLFHAQ